MIKSKEIAGPSCLTSAADDEPVFVLRANDELAPQTILDWADKYCFSKGGWNRMTKRQQEKCTEAAGLANEMRHWKATHPAPAPVATAPLHEDV